MPVGPPPTGEAKLIVRKGGDRTGVGATSAAVSPLAGATFEFYRASSTGQLTGGTYVESCITDASGQCGIFAPLAAPTDYFYAVETVAPPGWRIPVFWNTPTDYVRYNTGAIAQSASAQERTVTLPRPSLSNPDHQRTWPDVRDNNAAPPQCGLDVAVVMDLSNSVTETEAIFTDYKAAGNSLVDALTGTPSAVALYNFATNVPANGVGNQPLPLTSVATTAGASAVKARMNQYTGTPIYEDGGTNWDRGFHQVAESGVDYDVVLFMTDGQPTYHRDAKGPGDFASLAEVEHAIHSANAVKQTGARVIVVGIGDQAFTDAAANRMSLISGPTENSDFYRTSFDALGQTLRDIATAECVGTVSVVKEIQTAGGQIVPGGAGWTFQTDTANVSPASATTDDTSAVNFDIDYPAGTTTLPVTVTEQQRPGYLLVQQNGQNAVCTNSLTDGDVPVTNAGATGFTIDVPATAVVTCVVRNQEAFVDLTVTKTALPTYDRDYDWTINKLVRGADRQEVPAGEDATFTYDVVVTPSGPTDSGHRVTGAITVTNPNTAPITGITVVDSAPGAVCSVPYGGWDRTLGPGQSTTLGYTCTLPGGTATTSGTNTVRVTWNAAAYPGSSGQATAQVPFDFAAAEVNITDAQVVVTDTEVDLSDYPGGNVVNADDGPRTFTYDIDWTGVPGECADYDNTATIRRVPANGPGTIVGTSTETVTVCTGLDLQIDKNVVLNYDRTYLWDIDKEVDQTTITVGPDGTATFDYVVTATPLEYTDSAWAMQGVITVVNPNQWLDITADVTDLTDVGGGAECTVAGGEDVVIAAGATQTFSYTCTFTSQPSFEGTNTARVTWDADLPTPSRSAQEVVPLSSGGWSQRPINSTILVVDDRTDPLNPVTLGTAVWNAAGTPSVFPYSLPLAGEAGTCVDYTNTAAIVQTGQEADQTVTVCREAPPEVTKTAAGAFDRTYEWDIDKSVEDTEVVVDEDGQATFEYVVEAVPGDWTDSGWRASGQITVTNPNDFAALTVTVTDDVGGDGQCTVVDGEDVLVPAGGTVTLDYECTFPGAPDSYEGLNTAEVAWTDADETDRTQSTEAAFTFEVDGETDRVVDVYDQLEDDAPELLGQAEWSAEGTPQAFAYERTHQGVGGACVEFTNTAWVDIAAGEDPSDSATVEVCADSPLEHDKTVVLADQLATGQWLVRYEIEVVNDSTYDAVYDLSDTIEFGGGITPVAAGWFPAGNPAGGGTWSDLPDELTAVLATDAPIAAGQTHTYVVVVTAEVAAGVTGSEPGLCSGEEGTDGGGFLNAARLVSGDLDEVSRDCAEPAAPTIDKTAGGLVDNGDGTWTVTYDVVVDNPSDTHDLYYDLADELGFAEGVVVESAAVTRGGTTYEDWDGETQTAIVAAELLPAGARHTYRVSVVVSLAQVLDEDVRSCGINGSNAGQGLFNEAILTSGNDSYDDEACVPIPEPDLEVTKTATAADQNADGTWTVTYQVLVRNAGSVGGTYDLSDTLEYGEGITPVSAAWSLPAVDEGGTWDLAAGDTTVLATGRPIAGGATHTYDIEVVASLAQGVVGSDPGQCSGEDGTAGGGFLNAATLTAYGQSQTDRDCLEPVLPDFDKVFGSAVQDSDRTWRVTYALVADNTENDSRVFYDLHDMPGFAAGVTILGQSVRDVTVPAAPVDIEWDGVSPVVEGAELPAGAVHRYEVTFHLRVSSSIPAENLTCDPQVGQGRGLFNAAELVSGPDTIAGEDCAPIEESVVPDVAKSVHPPVLNADGTWTVSYDIHVTTPDPGGDSSHLATVYTLRDELRFGEGITVLESSVTAGEATPQPLATWTGLPPDTEVTDGEVVIGLGQTHTYRVTVVAAVAAGVVGTEAGECYDGEEVSAGGFLNTVVLATGASERSDDACAEPREAPWTLEKTSDPVSGSQVRPGDTISYTVTARPTGPDAPVNLTVRDDLSGVLDHARGTGTIEVSTGSFEWDGDVLVWHIPRLSEAHTLTYQVRVDDDAWNVTLLNVVTGEPDPLCIGDCSTTHHAPPKPGLPVTGAALVAPALAAVLLALLGTGLMVTRRRR